MYPRARSVVPRGCRDNARLRLAIHEALPRLAPYRRFVQCRREVRRDIGREAMSMHPEIAEEQVAADSRRDGRNAAFHARHIALRPAEADKPRRIVNMDVA